MPEIVIKRLTVGQMQANCYLVWDSASKDSVIIDPGDDADYIVQNIQNQELVPKAIIATHGHFDHTMAVLSLKLIFQIPFYMHQDDIFLTSRINSTAKHFIKTDPGPPPSVDFFLSGDSEVVIGGIKLKIISTPGHTPGSVCLYAKSKKALFVGDLIFADGYIGRTDFSYSNKQQFLNSLDMISKLPGDTIVYPGHGEEFLAKHYFKQK